MNLFEIADAWYEGSLTEIEACSLLITLLLQRPTVSSVVSFAVSLPAPLWAALRESILRFKDVDPETLVWISSNGSRTMSVEEARAVKKLALLLDE